MKRRKKVKRIIHPKYILYVLMGVCVIMTYVSYVYKDAVSPVKTAVAGILEPMQNGINAAGSFIYNEMQVLRTKRSLLEENSDLKEKISDLQSQNSILVTDGYELSELRQLYEVGEKYSDYPMVAATVISRDSNGFFDSFTVNRGSNDGIETGMNVIAQSGLVGIVTETGADYCKIRSIIDDTSYVSAMFLRTSDTCDVKGDLTLINDGYIRVEAISLDADIEENDEIVTSYISEKYLPGILIGYVTQIKTASDNLSKTAYLTPAVDFMHINNVLIIKQLKQQADS